MDGQDGRRSILVVDDDPAILRQLEWGLSEDYHVLTADSVQAALDLLAEGSLEAVTLDLHLENDDPESGFRLLDRFLEQDANLKVILVTGHDTRENALRAVDRGAFDLFTKPIDLDELRILLRRAVALRELEVENARLRERLRGEAGLGKLLGHSPQIQAVFETVRKVAPTDVTVLVTGQSGTGKELAAREIHRLSARHAGPFVGISCAAIPENLLESELFGHERGAFTDAHATKQGKLELANGGTVFLDEIGEMPVALQAKILRFLQEREIERVGGRQVISLDVRVIAATNRNLRAEVSAGRFREDLYFRLSVVEVPLPALRERKADIVYLAQCFLDRYASRFGRKSIAFNREALRALQRYAWPGNVRELEHRIQRAIVLTRGRVVRPEDLELAGEDGVQALTLRGAREHAERRVVTEALRRTCVNIARAAKELEISRPTLHDLLRKLDVHAADFKDGIGPDGGGESA
jgi:two-component system NtrC family response regulator